MIKRICILFVSILLLLLSSCVPYRHPTPWGTWVSYEPNTTLFVTHQPHPETGYRFSGIYESNGEIIDLAAFFHAPVSTIWLHYAPMVRESGGTSELSLLFEGTRLIVNNQLHFTLTEEFQDKTGFDVIIFHRADNDLINHDDGSLH